MPGDLSLLTRTLYVGMPFQVPLSYRFQNRSNTMLTVIGRHPESHQKVEGRIRCRTRQG